VANRSAPACCCEPSTPSRWPMPPLHLDLTAIRFSGSYPDSDLIARAGPPTDVRPADQNPASHTKPAFRYISAHTRDPATNCLPSFTHWRPWAARCHLACSQSPTPAWATWPTSAPGRRRHPFRRTTACRHRLGATLRERSRCQPGHPTTLDHTAAREQHLPENQRTVWKGLLRPFPVTAKDTAQHHNLRVAYIHSSQEAATVAAARQRRPDHSRTSLATCPQRTQRPPLQDKKQLDAKVAKILGRNITGLLHVTTATHAGNPPSPGIETPPRSNSTPASTASYALATNLPTPPNSAHRPDVLTIYKDQWMSSNAPRPQTKPQSPPHLPAQRRPDRSLIAIVGVALLIFGLIEADLRTASAHGIPSRTAPRTPRRDPHQPRHPGRITTYTSPTPHPPRPRSPHHRGNAPSSPTSNIPLPWPKRSKLKP